MWMGLGSNRWLSERFSLLWFASQSRMSDISHVSTCWLSVSMWCSELGRHWDLWCTQLTSLESQHYTIPTAFSSFSLYGLGSQITYSQWQTARLCVEEFGIYDSCQKYPRLDKICILLCLEYCDCEWNGRTHITYSQMLSHSLAYSWCFDATQFYNLSHLWTLLDIASYTCKGIILLLLVHV